MSNPEDKPIKPNDDVIRQTVGGLSHELQSFEARLAKLSPRDDRLDRERLLYLAGQASITAARDGTSLPAHDWSRHPAWPAAFVGMSALAATLLAILLAGPAATNSSPVTLQNFTSSDRLEEAFKSTDSERSSQLPGTLSPRDAIHFDIEKLSSNPLKESVAPPEAVDLRSPPALTPGAWQEFSEGLAPSVPPAGSSYLPFLQGVTS